MFKVGYLGLPGSNSEEALFQFFPSDVDAVSVGSFEEIFKKLEEDQLVYGVLPLENSSTGAITEAYDLLFKYNHYIVGETFVKVSNNLLAIEGATLSDIEVIYTHPQVIEQCKTFLTDHKLQSVPYYNTAQSAALVKKENLKKYAAIANKKAAEIYGLNIILEDISSLDTNTTRFAILGKNLKPNNQCNKISLVFSVAHEAGSLFNALRALADSNINMMKIESRPKKHTPWEYYFYVDIEGSLTNVKIKNALEEMKPHCHEFKILGNYKTSMLP